MDIKKYISQNCSYGYVIECDNGNIITVILGYPTGPLDKKASLYNQNISRKHKKMKEISFHSNLTKEDEVVLAETMSSMKSLCNVKMEGFSTLSEQFAFVDSLSTAEIQQIEEQIKLRMLAEKYYSKHF